MGANTGWQNEEWNSQHSHHVPSITWGKTQMPYSCKVPTILPSNYYSVLQEQVLKALPQA
jgi:hypothetical protein